MKIQMLAILVVALCAQACSVVQATSGPKNKDLSVLDVGTERGRVLAELGQPVVTEQEADGAKSDIFNIMQGQHGAVKAGKAVLYGTLALATFGVSEIVASPLEGATNKGAEIQMKVIYDGQDQVKEVVVFKDDRWVPVQKLEKEANE